MDGIFDSAAVASKIPKRKRNSKRRAPSRILESLNHTRLATQRIRSLFGERKQKRLVLDELVNLFASRRSFEGVLEEICTSHIHRARIKGQPENEVHNLSLKRSQLQLAAGRHRILRSQWAVFQRANVAASAQIREAESRVMFWHDELRSVKYTHWCMQQVEYVVGGNSIDEEEQDTCATIPMQTKVAQQHKPQQHRPLLSSGMKTGHHQRVYSVRELQLARKEELMLQRGYVRSYITGKDPVFHKSDYLLEVIRKELTQAREVLVDAHRKFLKVTMNEETIASQLIGTWWTLCSKHIEVAVVRERWITRVEKMRVSKQRYEERRSMLEEDRASFIHQRWPSGALKLQKWWRRLQTRRARELEEEVKRHERSFVENMREMLKKAQELRRWKCSVCDAPKRTPYKSWGMVTDHLARHRDEDRAEKRRKIAKDRDAEQRTADRAKKEVEFIRAVKPGLVGANGHVKRFPNLATRVLADGEQKSKTYAKTCASGNDVAGKSTVASESKRVSKSGNQSDGDNYGGTVKKITKNGKKSHMVCTGGDTGGGVGGSKKESKVVSKTSLVEGSSAESTRIRESTVSMKGAYLNEQRATRIQRDNSESNFGVPTTCAFNNNKNDNAKGQKVEQGLAKGTSDMSPEKNESDLVQANHDSRNNLSREGKTTAIKLSSTGARLIGTASRVALAALKARSRAAGARLEPKKKHMSARNATDIRAEEVTRISSNSNKHHKLPFSLARKNREKKERQLISMFAPTPMHLPIPISGGGGVTNGKMVPAIVWVDPSLSSSSRGNNVKRKTRTKNPSTRLSDYLENLCKLNPIYPRGAILLDQSSLTIGRSHCCSVTLDSKRYSKLLSKQHATISLHHGAFHHSALTQPFGIGPQGLKQQQVRNEDEDLHGVVAYITDNCSTNGTSLDGMPLESLKNVRLRDGAVITFGSCPKNPKQNSELVFRFMFLSTV